MKQRAWSYSALTSFETCPHRHYRTKVAKDVREPETEALRWGNNVHKALELRAKDGTPLPTGMTQWEPMMQQLDNVEGNLLAETQIALTEDFQQTTWFGRNVWLRAVIDWGKVQGDKVVALDYKTGKQKFDMDQLKLFAGVLFAALPVDKVVAGYVWLKDRAITKEVFVRENRGDIWGVFLPRVEKLNKAHETNNWPKKPSGLCGRYCPVHDCEHNGRYGR